jgi:hypothetical protein
LSQSREVPDSWSLQEKRRKKKFGKKLKSRFS